MIIQISDGLLIEKDDERNWTVKTGRVVESGKTAGQMRWDAFGYYSSLEAACRGCLEVKAARSTKVHQGIHSAISELRDLWSEIQAGATV